MKSAQQRAESAARAICPDIALNSFAATPDFAATIQQEMRDTMTSIILRETGLEGLVECEAVVRMAAQGFECHDGQPCCDPNDKCRGCRVIDAARLALSKLTPPEA